MRLAKSLLLVAAAISMVSFAAGPFASDTEDLDGDIISSQDIKVNYTSSGEGDKLFVIPPGDGSGEERADLSQDSGDKDSLDVSLTSGDGSYELRIRNVSNNSNLIDGPVNLDLDTQPPSDPSLISPESPTSDDRPDIEIELSDQSSLDQSTVEFSFEDSPTDYDGGIESVSVQDGSVVGEPDSDLEPGTYSLSLSVNDSAGNRFSGSDVASFEYDGSYDGSETADFSPTGIVSGDQQNVFLEVTPETDDDFEDQNLRGGCYESDDLDDRYDSLEEFDAGDSNAEFSCEIDLDEYQSQDTIYIDFLDEAGNRLSDSEDPIETSFEIDSGPPIVGGLQIENSAENGVVSSNPQISFDVEEETSDVEEVVYYYDDEDPSQGSQLDYESDLYTLEPPMSPGNHEVHVAAKDDLQDEDGDSVWGYGPPDEEEFEYRPDADPSLGVSVPENVSVTSNQTLEVQVTLTNEGLVESNTTTLTLSSPLFSRETELGPVEPSSSVENTFRVSNSSLETGDYTAYVAAGEDNKTVNLLVLPTSSQKQEIEVAANRFLSRLSNASSQYASVKDSLKPGKRRVLNRRLGALNSSAEDIRTGLNRSNYVDLTGSLDNSTDALRSFSSNVTSENQRIKDRSFKNRLLILGGAIGMVILVAAVLLTFSSRFSFNPSRIFASDLNIDKPSDLWARLRSIFEDEDESEEFDWDGFED